MAKSRRFITVAGLRVRVGSTLYKWLQKNAPELLRKAEPFPVPPPPPSPKPKPAPKPAPAPKPKPGRIYMYDDVNVSLIPRTAKAAAGYVDGHWSTWLKLKLRLPRAKLVSIAVFPRDDADCLDVEPGDATNAQAPAWVRRQLARRKAGAKSVLSAPAVYTSASNGNALNDTLRGAGLRLGRDYLWWSAHYDPRLGEHLCSPKCYAHLRYTADATQFTDHANNVSLDESVCSPTFFR